MTRLHHIQGLIRGLLHEETAQVILTSNNDALDIIARKAAVSILAAAATETDETSFDITRLMEILDPHAGTIRCAGCGNTNLHLNKINAYKRDTEDASHAMRITVDLEQKDTLTVRTVDARTSPSPRRSGITLHFECENCEDTTTITIHQHKGAEVLTYGT